MREREYMSAEPSLPGKATSLWIDTAAPTSYPRLSGAHDTDVAVVGGGLAGVLTAVALREAGKRVALVDAGRVGCGTSGHTTAKVTAQHAFIYRDLVDRLGEYEALTYATANMAGVNHIAGLVRRHGIACDFHWTPFRLFALDDEQVGDIRDEAEVAKGFGLPVTLEPPREVPFHMPAVMRVDYQAQFHPLRFVVGLLEAMAGDGFAVFEDTRAMHVDDGTPCRVVCESGEVTAKQVVVATQFPMYDHGAFFSRLYPYADYALALRLKGRTDAAMLHDARHFGIRTYPAPGDTLLVLSGEEHKSGQGGDEREKYRALDAWGRERYPVDMIEYHWSAEDYHTPDGIPYIGASPGSDRVYLATGFGGWGMTNSAVSAMLIGDLILGRPNRWAEVFDPSRARPGASWREFLKENANVGMTLVGGKLAPRHVGAPGALRAGQGAIVSQGGERYAAYRELDGTLRLLAHSCTHMGCEVGFNEAEKTWDCPCHGSRFSVRGEIIHGPAPHPLRAVEAPRPSSTR